MTRARKHLVCAAETPYYHITSRCVRRAFLCGVDGFSGRSYEHRRDWIEARIRVLSSMFTIQICAYAVMSNHYHLVVKLSPREATGWSDDDVLERWTSLYKGTLLAQRYRAGAPLRPAERETLCATIAIYRRRLTSLSWFMKCLNEPIARQANAEDGCTGHFWEARFYSQALMTERALISAMAYVDLNPVRARMARTPTSSAYTSFRARIRGDKADERLSAAISAIVKSGELNRFDLPLRLLMRFADPSAANDPECLPIKEKDYRDLVHSAAVALRTGRHRRMTRPSAILNRLGLSTSQWLAVSCGFKNHYRNGDLKLTKTA